MCLPSATQPKRNNTSSHAGGPASPDRVLPLAPHTQATAGWVGNGGPALSTSIQLGLGWAAAAQAASVEASEQLEVRPYTNTRCFSSRLMSAYPRHKLSPTYTEGSQAPFPGSTQALLTHSRMGLGVQKSESTIRDPWGKGKVQASRSREPPSYYSLNKFSPSTHFTQPTKPHQELSLCPEGDRHSVCSKNVIQQRSQCGHTVTMRTHSDIVTDTAKVAGTTSRSSSRKGRG